MKESVYKCELVGDLLVSFATAGPISDQDWTTFIDFVKMPAVVKYLGASVGATEASSVQRKEAAALFKARRIPVAVVTDAGLVRGIVTAVSWLGVDIKAFDWPDLAKALEHLKVTGAQQQKAADAILRMKAKYTR